MAENKKVIKNENIPKKVENIEPYPYEELFQEKERLLNKRMEDHENLIYQELMKKFIKRE